MATVLLVIVALIVVGTGWALIKGKPPVMVLLLSGMAITLLTLIVLPDVTLLDEDTTSGSRWFDLFGLVEQVSMSQLTGVGLIIMMAGGFSAYMSHIGATRALVDLVATPISRMGHPYVLLVLAYVVGQLLVMVIPSAAGLAILLLVTFFPILVAAGVTPAAAGAVIASVSALPMGPGTGTVILAAQTAGVSPAVYFVQNQLPVAIPTMVVIALVLIVTQRFFDRRDAGVVQKIGKSTADTGNQAGQVTAPKAYALFVIAPIVLLIAFSPLTNKSIEMSTVSAFFMVFIVTVLVELLRRRDVNAVMVDGKKFFTGMGTMFASVVSLIIAAQVFAESLKYSGAIDALIDAASHTSAGMVLIIVLMTAIVGLITFLTGSGVGAFSAFSGLTPNIATELGGTVTELVTPMQFAGGIFRSMSPISGVLIAVSAGIGVNPMTIAKRTAPAMSAGAVCMVVFSIVLG